jgi:hypothetical protein
MAFAPATPQSLVPNPHHRTGAQVRRARRYPLHTLREDPLKIERARSGSSGFEQVAHLGPRIGLQITEGSSVRIGHAAENRLFGRRPLTDALPPPRDPRVPVPHPGELKQFEPQYARYDCNVGERVAVAGEVRSVLCRILDPREQLSVMLDRLFNEPGIEPVWPPRHVCTRNAFCSAPWRSRLHALRDSAAADQDGRR